MRLSMPYLRRHRFELLLALLLFISGIPYLLGIPKPTSVDRLLPPYVQTAWNVALLAGSLGIIVGLMLMLRRVEFVGLLILSWPALMYAAAVIIFTYNDEAQLGRGIYTSALAVAIALFCLDRAWELWRPRG